MRARQRTVLLVLLLTSTATLSALAGTQAATGPCYPDTAGCVPCVPEPMEGVGLVCPTKDGLLAVFDPSGGFLGFSHGPDPILAPHPEGSSFPPITFDRPYHACSAGQPGDYYVRLMYVRAADDEDRFAEALPILRGVAMAASDLVNDAARVTGASAALRLACDAEGRIEVLHVVVPTSKTADNFGTIITDVRAQGHTDPRVKHWIYYDDTVNCSCSGQATLRQDDRLILENTNNGNEALYALTYGVVYSMETMLHELAHTMGAVQHSAPHSTKGGHCHDGYDLMCYNDGGPNGHLYADGRCLYKDFDCGNDDYFHANPPAGSWLASHWNLGSRLNRFIQFHEQPDQVWLRLYADYHLSMHSHGATYPFVGGHALGPGTSVTLQFGDRAPIAASTNDTSWSAEWDPTGVPEGPITLRLKATAADGRVSTSNRTLMIMFFPEITVTSPPHNSRVGGAFVVNGTASDRFGIDWVSIGWYGAFEPRHRAEGTTTWTSTLDSASRRDGTQIISICARSGDPAGTCVNAYVIVDNTIRVNVSAPREGAAIPEETQLEGYVTTLAQVDRVEVSLDGGPWMPAEGTRPWRLDVDTSALAAGPEGKHVFHVRATNSAGRVAETNRTMFVDATPPTVDLLAEPGDVRVFALRAARPTTEGPALFVGPVIVGASAEDAMSGIGAVEFCVFDRENVLVECERDASAPYQASYWSGLVPRQPGLWRLSAQAFDRAGNGSEIDWVDVIKV